MDDIYDVEMASCQEPVCDEMTKDLMLRMGCSEEVARLCGLAVGTQNLGNVCLGPLSDADCKALKATSAVACHAPGESEIEPTPFILSGNFLYTRRNWLYEQTVRNRVLKMSKVELGNEIVVPDDGVFAQLKVRQRQAVEMMCSKQFSLLTGGPGTGKTYTIARAVKLIREKGEIHLGLVAPTGKAAARVKESMVKEAEALGLNVIPTASTIHKLLEPNYDLVTFKHNKNNLLPLNWLIVDEASMIDLPMMAKLLDALPDDCRLTLVGDANQLASVEAGHVFGDLCNMKDVAKCELNVSQRFSQDGEIFTLASAVNNNCPQEALKILHSPSDTLHYYQLKVQDAFKPQNWTKFFAAVKEHFKEFSRQTTAEDAIKRINDCRILCAMRKGPYGVNFLNKVVLKLLEEKTSAQPHVKTPVPMMITKNDKMLGVNNGDVGVVMPKDDYLSLPTDDGQTIRRIPLDLLPDLEMAFASSIHKSQGSEYENVVIVLPPNPISPESQQLNPLLTREILYTAITRTKKGVFLFGSDASIEACCSHAICRQTGLAKE